MQLHSFLKTDTGMFGGVFLQRVEALVEVAAESSGGSLLPPHELPEQSEGEGSIPGVQVLTGDAHQRELGLLLSQLHGVVTVLQLQHRHRRYSWTQTFCFLIQTTHQLSRMCVCSQVTDAHMLLNKDGQFLSLLSGIIFPQCNAQRSWWLLSMTENKLNWSSMLI